MARWDLFPKLRVSVGGQVLYGCVRKVTMCYVRPWELWVSGWFSRLGGTHYNFLACSSVTPALSSNRCRLWERSIISSHELWECTSHGCTVGAGRSTFTSQDDAASEMWPIVSKRTERKLCKQVSSNLYTLHHILSFLNYEHFHRSIRKQQ